MKGFTIFVYILCIPCSLVCALFHKPMDSIAFTFLALLMALSNVNINWRNDK